MPTQQRRERERADRESLIIRVARELAEAEGWDAVTTRRLAERIEYSQPVLYSHFAGKTAIVTAVALEGFAELTAALATARRSTTDPAAALSAVAHAYVGFAQAGPALYEAMFTLATDLPFGPESAPAPSRPPSPNWATSSARWPQAGTWCCSSRSAGPPCTVWSPSPAAAASTRTSRPNGSTCWSVNCSRYRRRTGRSGRRRRPQFKTPLLTRRDTVG